MCINVVKVMYLKETSSTLCLTNTYQHLAGGIELTFKANATFLWVNKTEQNSVSKIVVVLF